MADSQRAGRLFGQAPLNLPRSREGALEAGHGRCTDPPGSRRKARQLRRSPGRSIFPPCPTARAPLRTGGQQPPRGDRPGPGQLHRRGRSRRTPWRGQPYRGARLDKALATPRTTSSLTSRRGQACTLVPVVRLLHDNARRKKTRRPVGARATWSCSVARIAGTSRGRPSADHMLPMTVLARLRFNVRLRVDPNQARALARPS